MPSVTCPFCPLACDDLAIRRSTLTLDVDCALAQQGFAAVSKPSPPRAHLQSFDQADWRSALKAIDLPEVPSLATQSVSLEEAKRLSFASESKKIALADSSTASSRAWKLATLRDGFIGATFGEMQRLDRLVWLIGSNQGFPVRLPDRLASANVPIIRTAVLTLGSLSRLSSLTSDLENPTQAESGLASEHPDLAAIASAVEGGQSVGVVIGNDAFAKGEEILSAEWLNRLIGQWNRPLTTTENEPEGRLARAVSMHFDENMNLHSVARWKTNCDPFRTLKNAPDIWLGSASHWTPPVSASSGRIVNVQIGGTDPGADFVTIYVPASLPGIGQRGTTIRGDSAVTLPLDALYPNSLPDRMDVLEELLLQNQVRWKDARLDT